MLSPSLFIQWCFHFILAKGKGLSLNCFYRWVWFGDDNKSNAFNSGLLFIGSSVCCWWPPKTSLASAATSSGETSHYLYQAFKAAKNGEAVLIGFKGCLVGCIKQERHLAYSSGACLGCQLGYVWGIIWGINWDMSGASSGAGINLAQALKH